MKNDTKTLTQVVEEYFATVTPEQLKKDLTASNFDLYNRVGEKLSSDTIDNFFDKCNEAMESYWDDKAKEFDDMMKDDNSIQSRLFRGRRGKRTRIEDRAKYI